MLSGKWTFSVSEQPSADPISAYSKVKTENIGYGEITKTDESSGVKLAGAVYGIYSDSGCTNLVGKMTTDSNGYAKSKALVAGEYSDEGKSGKNIEGRPQFLQMLKDIESGKDKVEFVLVFKLSRFGRNAADVLSSLQRMQDFGVNLICVEDGIDSSKDSGKLMISV